MFGWGEDDHREVYGQQYPPEQHEAKFSHELIAGAASFEAMKAWEDHQRREGEPVSHGFAKEALAGLAGAEVDKLFETKGLDFMDREETKRRAEQQVQYNYDQHYGQQQQWQPQQQPPFNYNQYNYGGYQYQQPY